jgi:23S rRNA (cytosine1962-C5)-methyltransferase
METIRLRQDYNRRIRGGYLWIFSNEVETSLRGMEPGALVRLADAHNRFIGIAYANPHALVCARILTFQDQAVDRGFFERRILESLSVRRLRFPADSCYRLVFGESDLLPGLVVDRYDRNLVVQSFTAGMDRLLPVLLDILQDALQPQSIVLRNDSSMRRLENLEFFRSVVRGHLPESATVSIEGLTYRLDLLNGHKTGFFLDQRLNHLRTRPYAAGKRVLDCFTHVGGWALNAARFGATAVTGIDVSESAIAQCEEHALLNHLPQCSFRTADVFNELKRINEQHEQFDIIVLDPPAFAKSRADVGNAVKGYREVNRRAAKAVAPGGILVTCSCTHVVEYDTFRNTVLQGVLSAGRNAVILGELAQPEDHPVLLSMRETEYLKGFILRVF